MDQPLPAYAGDEPYVFVSYAHADEEALAEIRWLQDRGVNVWYDTTGIGPGSEWNDEIARAIQGASCFLFFITPQSVSSEYCRRELNFAQAEGKPVIAVHMKVTDVPPGLRLSLENRQAILKHRLRGKEYQSLLLEALTAREQVVNQAAQSDEPPRRAGVLWFAAMSLVVMSIAGGYFLWPQDELSEAGESAAGPRPTATLESEVVPPVFVPGSTPEPGGTDNAEAHGHYLAGREFYNADPERAIRELTAAVESDPDFALAWVTLSLAYGARSRDPAVKEAALADMSTAAARAVSLAPNLWHSHDALGWYLMARRDFIGADRAFRKVLELARAQGVAPHPAYTQYLWQLGRNTERLALIQSIQHLDPLYPLARSLYFLGKREETIAELERTRGTRTTIGGTRWWVSVERWLVLERGDPEEMNRTFFIGTPLEGLWGTDAFIDSLNEIVRQDMQLTRGALVNLAYHAARLDEIELALQLLRMEYLQDGYAAHFLIWHPVLAPVRSTPGFKDFLEELGLAALFRETGKWNDYCEPEDGDGFRCR